MTPLSTRQRFNLENIRADSRHSRALPIHDSRFTIFDFRFSIFDFRTIQRFNIPDEIRFAQIRVIRGQFQFSIRTLPSPLGQAHPASRKQGKSKNRLDTRTHHGLEKARECTRTVLRI